MKPQEGDSLRSANSIREGMDMYVRERGKVMHGIRVDIIVLSFLKRKWQKKSVALYSYRARRGHLPHTNAMQCHRKERRGEELGERGICK